MKIRYLGHSCFQLIESTGTSIVCDPYGDVGFFMPHVCADAVTVSHAHYDHNNVGAVTGEPVVFDQEGQFEISGITIQAIKCWHDGEKGAKRGQNLIFKFRMDGIEVCHLGDLGEKCTASLIEAVLPVQVLLIPVGGNYTIDAAQAKEYVDRIRPSIVIPMHYKTKGLNIDIAELDEFTDLFDGEILKTNESEIKLSRDNVMAGSTKMIVLERDRVCK